MISIAQTASEPAKYEEFFAGDRSPQMFFPTRDHSAGICANEAPRSDLALLEDVVSTLATEFDRQIPDAVPGSCENTIQHRHNERCICDRIHAVMATSRYPLRSIRCSCDEQVLCLSGTVGRYFYLQMAIELVRTLANRRRIELKVKITRPDADRLD